MKITEQTTLAELAIERARLGIEEMSIHINTKGARTCAVFGNGRGCQVAGKTEAEAIDAAFRKFELAAAGTEGQARFERVNEVDHEAMPVTRAPLLPSGSYKATMTGDPLGEKTMTIIEGAYAGVQLAVPPPTPYCPRSTIGGHACTNYQPENRCDDCPLRGAK